MGCSHPCWWLLLLLLGVGATPLPVWLDGAVWAPTPPVLDEEVPLIRDPAEGVGGIPMLWWWAKFPFSVPDIEEPPGGPFGAADVDCASLDPGLLLVVGTW